MNNMPTKCAYWAIKVDHVQNELCRFNGPSEELLNGVFRVEFSEYVGELNDELHSCNFCYRDMEDWRQRYIENSNKVRAMIVYQ
jgi:hypothetical protein